MPTEEIIAYMDKSVLGMKLEAVTKEQANKKNEKEDREPGIEDLIGALFIATLLDPLFRK